MELARQSDKCSGSSGQTFKTSKIIRLQLLADCDDVLSLDFTLITTDKTRQTYFGFLDSYLSSGMCLNILVILKT